MQEQLIEGSTTTQTNYIAGGQYVNGVLKQLSTGQGRITFNSRGAPRQEYYIKDHIGNIRSIVASAAVGGVDPGGGIGLMSYTAGYEPANQTTEEALFEEVSSVREDKPGSTLSADAKAALLDGTKAVGTSIMLKVMAGDRLSVNADNFYDLLNSDTSSTGTGGEAVFNQLLGSLTSGGGELQPLEGTQQTDLASRLFNNTDALTAYQNLLQQSTDSTRPSAYLNFLFFNEELNLVPEQSHIWQADGENDWSKIGIDELSAIEIPQNGYVVVYLSNQSSGEAYFDNLVINMSPGLLLEERHYYPYGLPIAGMGSAAVGNLKNKLRYQGNEYREEAGLNWMDFHNRQYDPQLGRFLGIDPMADAGGQQVLSPFHAMACNPVSFTDPMGLMPNGAGYYTMSSGQGQPTQRDILMCTAPSLFYDAMYGFNVDPAMTFNRALLETSEKKNNENFWSGLVGLLNEAAGNGGTAHASFSRRGGVTITANPSGNNNNGNDQYDDNQGGDWTLDGVKGTRVSKTFGNLTFNYSQYGTARTFGLNVFAVYSGDLSAYEKTDWIQSAYVTNGGKKQYEWFNDYDENAVGANPPFHYPNTTSRNSSIASRDSEFKGRTFRDRPNRPITGNYFGFSAELSLVGYRNGNWQTIVSVHYGFSTHGVNFYFTSPTFFSLGVTPFQQNLINSAKKP